MPVIYSCFSVCRLLPSFRSAFTGYFFVLPAVGFRHYMTGSSVSLASNGNYWSSTLEAGKSPRLYFSNSSANTSADILASGFSVRCVQAFTVTLLIFYFQTLITSYYHKLPTFTPSKEWHISGVPKAKAFGRVIHVNSVTYRRSKNRRLENNICVYAGYPFPLFGLPAFSASLPICFYSLLLRSTCRWLPFMP